jgi:hypothetical protein
MAKRRPLTHSLVDGLLMGIVIVIPIYSFNTVATWLFGLDNGLAWAIVRGMDLLMILVVFYVYPIIKKRYR